MKKNVTLEQAFLHALLPLTNYYFTNRPHLLVYHSLRGMSYALTTTGFTSRSSAHETGWNDSKEKAVVCSFLN
jgi:hypothetical protein